MVFKKYWQKLNKREKILFLIVIPVVIIALVQIVLLNPLDDEKKQIQMQMQNNSTAIDKITEQIAATQAQLAINSVVKLASQQKELKQQIAAQKKLLSSLMGKLVPPQIMASVIEKMLKRRGHLKLVLLENLPAVGFPETEEVDPATNKKKKPIIFRHPLQLKFEGKFFEVIKYLSDLEKSGYGFYWDAIDYQVEKYPNASIILELSTLGTEEQWMGAENNEQ